MKIGDYIRTTVNYRENNGLRRGSIGKILKINIDNAEVEFDFVLYKKGYTVKISNMKVIENPLPIHSYIGTEI